MSMPWPRAPTSCPLISRPELVHQKLKLSPKQAVFTPLYCSGQRGIQLGRDGEEGINLRDRQNAESEECGEETHPEEGRGLCLSKWVDGGTTGRERAGWRLTARRRLTLNRCLPSWVASRRVCINRDKHSCEDECTLDYRIPTVREFGPHLSCAPRLVSIQ